MEESNCNSKKYTAKSDVVTRRMFIKGVATSFGALPVFVWPRWAQAFYYNLGFFKKSSASSLYVEDVFSTYIYTGDGSSRTIANGIDLAGKGGLVWIKMRSASSSIHCIYDSARGFATDKTLDSSASNAQFNMNPSGLSGALANGFNIGTHAYVNTTAMHGGNPGPQNYTSWTFGKATKFLDVVTWTGNGGTQLINHSLGTVPGMIVVKCTSTSSDWAIWHRSLNPGYYILLNTDSAQSNNLAERYFGDNSTTVNPTSTNFRIGSSSHTNSAGFDYVAYVYAHDTAADGLIQCGTFTTDGAAKASVNLGWEAQYVMMKRKDSTGNWIVLDQTRGWGPSNYASLYSNTSGSEQSSNGGDDLAPTSTGFKVAAITSSDATYIYMAIRRGPMKVPTDATKVFKPINYVGGSGASSDKITTGFPVDMVITQWRQAFGAYAQGKNRVTDRLRGKAPYLSTQSAAAQDSASAFTSFDMDGLTFDNFYTVQIEGSNPNYINYCFRRAPGFFDMVCYTGTGVAKTEKHNLGVVPELMIIRPRNRASTNWAVFHSGLATTAGEYLILNSSSAKVTSSGVFNNTAPTATNFSVGVNWETNGDSSTTYVAYLFASCPGVSKIGTFTGAATDVTVPCGFSGQPRFVLVKRTDVSGYDWIMVDSARGTSVYLALNSVNSENSGTVITFTTGGFIAKAGTAANAAAGATYIYMAIA